MGWSWKSTVACNTCDIIDVSIRSKYLNTKHLKEIDEGYFTHFLCASYYSLRLLILSLGVLIHAFIPWVFWNNLCEGLDSIQKHIKERTTK